MNTRRAIQASNQPAVLSTAFSTSGHRFVAGLSDGLRCFRTDNCLTTYHPTLPTDGGVAIAEALDDRYLAFVGGGRTPAGKGGVVIWWDAVLGKEVSRFDFHEPVLGLRMTGSCVVVILQTRTIILEHQQLKRPVPDLRLVSPSEKTDECDLKGPNLVKALYSTAPNPYALACLHNTLLVLPAPIVGQVQLIPLPTGSKRVFRTHETPLRCIALSSSGTLLATASAQGTLIRVWNTQTQHQLFEFRRGVDKAIIFSLAFSPGERWLACTSDKGTLHVFDLRPPSAVEREKASRERHQQRQRHRKPPAYPNPHRPGTGQDATSTLSDGNLSAGRSSPASVSAAGHTHAGSIQEYYSLRPIPSPVSPPIHGPGNFPFAALKTASWAPKVLKDVRSVASEAFHIGDEATDWQGGAESHWTTAPGGKRQRVKIPAAALPAEPTGRAPKGILAFKAHAGGRSESDKIQDDQGAVLHVVGGGRDARWEEFALVSAEGEGWALLYQGFRRYLTRQFVD